VPLTTRPKELLLDVSLKTGDGRSCALLLKEQTAALQTDYISWFLGEELDPLVWNLLYGVSAHNVDAWKEFENSAHTEQERLRRFLDDGVRHFAVSISQVRNWHRIVRQAEIDLEAALDEPKNHYSATGNLLRAVPYVAYLNDADVAGALNTPNDVRLALKGLANLVSSCSPDERSLIAEYGRRWEVLVDLTVRLYASDMKGRRYYVDLKMKLALRPSIERALTAVQISLWLALVATALIPTTPELADNLALLVLPLTLVGAIVLTRESTAVAQRLQEDRRKKMVWLVAALWVIAGIRIMGAAFDSTWPWDSWESLVDVICFW